MRLRAGLLLVVCCAILSLFASSASATSLSDNRAIGRFIALVYAPYVHDHFDEPDTVWYSRGILSQSLGHIIHRNDVYAHGEEGLIDADILCSCQDYRYFHYNIGRIRRRANRAFVPIRMINSGTHMHVTLVLKSGGKYGFLIDDLIDDVYKPSFKVWLDKALREAPPWD